MDVADYVGDTGFSTIEAGRRQGAGDTFGRNDIHVVFTDVNMLGKVAGMALSGPISERWPRIGVIITSGMVRPRSGDVSPGALFFTKPYDLENLAASIRSFAA